jgi:hypothetical protein
MSAQSKLIGRLSMRLGPGWIIIGYILGLFAATAGVVAFPFSIISMGLFFVTIGAFFVAVIPILVLVYLFFLVAGYRALMALGRRLLFGAGTYSESQSMSKPLAPEPVDTGLWDQWIDGVW